MGKSRTVSNWLQKPSAAPGSSVTNKTGNNYLKLSLRENTIKLLVVHLKGLDWTMFKLQFWNNSWMLVHQLVMEHCFCVPVPAKPQKVSPLATSISLNTIYICSKIHMPANGITLFHSSPPKHNQTLIIGRADQKMHIMRIFYT